MISNSIWQSKIKPLQALCPVTAPPSPANTMAKKPAPRATPHPRPAPLPPDTWHARGVRSLRRRRPWPAAHADGVSGVERETVAEQWLPGLHAGYAYLDSEQRSGAFKGNEVPFASAHQLTVDGRYRFAEAWTYTLDGLYVSSAYTDAANSHAEDAVATGSSPTAAC